MFDPTTTLLCGDAYDTLCTLPSESVQCIVTSPPYFGLRDYGVEGQIGLEQTPEQYVDALVKVFREARRVLKSDGTFWLNLGDSYSAGGRGNGNERTGFLGVKTAAAQNLPPWRMKGMPPKNLIGIPFMAAFALRSDGWYLRSTIIWNKPNAMPESVTDRPTTSHEYMFLLAKSEQYFYDADAIREPAVSDHASGNGYARAEQISRGGRGSSKPWEPQEFRNKRSVWTVNTKPYSDAHFATYPIELIRPCILAGSRVGDTVLDPFNGAATTGIACLETSRSYIGIELNPDYIDISRRRIADYTGLFNLEVAI